MSENGCLVSSCFSTVTVHNEVVTSKAKLESHQGTTNTIQLNESGNQNTDGKDEVYLGTESSTIPHFDLTGGSVPATASELIKANSVTIAQPSRSILKNMYLIVTGNNFLVAAASGSTNLRIDIGTDIAGLATGTKVFESSGGGTIDIIQGGATGSILAMNTVIPLLMNYSTPRSSDIKNSIDKQGYCHQSGTPEELRVAIDGGIPKPGLGSLYNKQTTSRNLYISLRSSSATNPLIGAQIGSGGVMSSTNTAISNGVTVDKTTFKIVCDFQIIK
jgi:hypothetical protein